MLARGKPLTVWCPDIFEPEGIHSIIPVQMFDSRVVSLLTKIDDETVLIVTRYGKTDHSRFFMKIAFWV